MVPWSTFSPKALAGSPPPDASADASVPQEAIPLPRARPKIVAQRPVPKPPKPPEQ
jgi:hypothetical protein